MVTMPICRYAVVGIEQVVKLSVEGFHLVQ